MPQFPFRDKELMNILMAFRAHTLAIVFIWNERKSTKKPFAELICEGIELIPYAL